MAPLPPNSTNRFFLDYTDGINTHTIEWRYGDAVDVNDAMGVLDTVLNDLDPILHLITVLAARQSDALSNVTNPITWIGSFAYGSEAMPAVLAPRETRFQGRAFSGRKVSFSVYGGKYTQPATYRLLATAEAHVDAVVNHLNAAGTALQWLAIDGGVPTAYPYASVNYNNYWEKRARG